MMSDQFTERDVQSILACATEMADAAAEQTLPPFRGSSLGVENKDEAIGRFDPVTVADRAAEAAMRDVLARLRPQDGILGEEMGSAAGTSGLTWVLDPIDGTRAYMIGAPTWGTLIGLCDDAGPVFGMIDQPFTGERWLGGFGRAHLLRSGQRTALQTRATERIEDAIMCTTFPEIGTDDARARFQRVSRRTQLTRYGLDCYGYALVASGTVDLVIEAGLHAYDVCGPIGVVEAAGGIVTDWQGNPVHKGGQVIAAANATLHSAALELLNSSEN